MPHTTHQSFPQYCLTMHKESLGNFSINSIPPRIDNDSAFYSFSLDKNLNLMALVRGSDGKDKRPHWIPCQMNRHSTAVWLVLFCPYRSSNQAISLFIKEVSLSLSWIGAPCNHTTLRSILWVTHGEVTRGHKSSTFWGLFQMWTLSHKMIAAPHKIPMHASHVGATNKNLSLS